MSCRACADFERNPSTHGVTPHCRGCQLREIARGPEYFASKRINAMTCAYRDRLRSVFGAGVEEITAGNAQVKALAEQMGKARG